MLTTDLHSYICDVPDFPQPGIVFKDITPLLASPDAFKFTVGALSKVVREAGAEELLAIESRGFIFGAAIAAELSLPLQLVRKPGKLPRKTVRKEYALEYGTDCVELHVDAVHAGRRYALVDDVIATGGTAAAAADLVTECGGVLACCAFVIELGFLGGRSRLPAGSVNSLLIFD
jgi:adenine phosphoribosyltransferase